MRLVIASIHPFRSDYTSSVCGENIEIYSLSDFHVHDAVSVTVITMLWATSLDPQNLLIVQLEVWALGPAAPHIPVPTFSASVRLAVLGFPPVSELIRCCSLSVWLISLSAVPSSSSPVADGRISLVGECSIAWKHHAFFMPFHALWITLQRTRGCRKPTYCLLGLL